MLYKSSAPANLMLLGEYAVLDGHPALAMAVNKRLTVSLKPREDNIIIITSALGTHQTTIDNINVVAPFDFALCILQQHNLPSGCNINITTDFSHLLGLGSSAALTASLTATLAKWLNLENDLQSLWHRGIKAIRQVQGHGSGADLAASLWGGVIHLHNKPITVKQLATDIPLSVVYSGSKQITANAIPKQLDKSQANPNKYKQYNKSSDDLVAAATTAINNQHWQNLGALLDKGHELLAARNVSNKHLDELCRQLRKEPEMTGAKISGAGYGDCVIGLGTISNPTDFLSTKQLNLGCEIIHTIIDEAGTKYEQ